MAFKKPPAQTLAPESPDQLFIDLPRRKYPSQYDHQGQMLRNYYDTALNEPDVALQLPTGSGKTLVGLLLAEWRRRKFAERVVYLCPTRQLVNQVAAEASLKYGLNVEAFTGRVKEYTPEAKAAYQGAERIAVTTYNSVFNTNPFFDDPEIVVVDDAHAAENYIANHWSLQIRSHEESERVLFDAVSQVLKGGLSRTSHARLTRAAQSVDDAAWVDKLPTHELVNLADELIVVVDENIADIDQRFPWSVLRDNLLACQVYVGAGEILIRPLIPPTGTHEAFAGASQRIYMSATLGAGGDLERLTGRSRIKRLAIPKGWEHQGIGRRFFLFPEKSLTDEETTSLKLEMMEEAGRSLVLAPSNPIADATTKEVSSLLKYPVFTAKDLETGKENFVNTERAVAVVANRYDGIDLPGDECRLLLIEGLPKATHLQERFLMTRMGSNLLFNERLQTRVVQAVGRCTRGLNDYSAVVVTGEALPAYLTDRKRRQHLHPELQAELEFGIHQSSETDSGSLMENFRLFLEHDAEWEAANVQILASRASAAQIEFPAMTQLGAAVAEEIRWQDAMWGEDYESAFDAAREVLGLLTDPLLRGYRACWHYLAGSAAELAASRGSAGFDAKARAEFVEAKKAAAGIPWLVELARGAVPDEGDNAPEQSPLRMLQIEELERRLEKLGTVHNRAFTARERKIRTSLNDNGSFEEALILLGEHLGFSTGKRETDGSPDPWWQVGEHVIVFEAHANVTNLDGALSATKARQAATHPDWIRSHLQLTESDKIQAVLVSPIRKASSGAVPHLQRFAYWNLAEFREWAETALGTVRDLRKTFTEAGHLDWRAEAAQAFSDRMLDMISLSEFFKKHQASEQLQPIP